MQKRSGTEKVLRRLVGLPMYGDRPALGPLERLAMLAYFVWLAWQAWQSWA